MYCEVIFQINLVFKLLSMTWPYIIVAHLSLDLDLITLVNEVQW